MLAQTTCGAQTTIRGAVTLDLSPARSWIPRGVLQRGRREEVTAFCLPVVSLIPSRAVLDRGGEPGPPWLRT